MSKVAEIERRIDTEYSGQIPLTGLEAGGSLVPTDMKQAMEFAKMMSVAGPMVGAAFRQNPGACLGIAMQAWRWEMDPFPVSQKAYVTVSRGGVEAIGYEAQLIAAVINTRAPLKEPLEYTYAGDGPKRRCTVSGKLRGSDKVLTVESPPMGEIGVKNSPLWKSDPDQQLGYYTVRNWGRRHCPEVLLGVYDVDELQTFRGPDNAREINPQSSSHEVPPAPKMADFVDGDASEVATLETPESVLEALQAAETIDDLNEIWEPVYTDGTLQLWRVQRPAVHRDICKTYNERKCAFELARSDDTEVLQECADDLPAEAKYVQSAIARITNETDKTTLERWWTAEALARSDFGLVDDAEAFQPLKKAYAERLNALASEPKMETI